MQYSMCMHRKTHTITNTLTLHLVFWPLLLAGSIGSVRAASVHCVSAFSWYSHVLSGNHFLGMREREREREREQIKCNLSGVGQPASIHAEKDHEATEWKVTTA